MVGASPQPWSWGGESPTHTALVGPVGEAPGQVTGASGLSFLRSGHEDAAYWHHCLGRSRRASGRGDFD